LNGSPLSQIFVHHSFGFWRAAIAASPFAVSVFKRHVSNAVKSAAPSIPKRSRILAVVDDFTRECLALVADTSLSGLRGRARTADLQPLLAMEPAPLFVVQQQTLAP